MSSTRKAADAWSADADLTEVYLSEVGATPLLSAAEEVELARRVEAGVYAEELLRAADAGESTPLTPWRRKDLCAVAVDGQSAKDHMIRANLRLVVSVAKKHSYRGLPFLDVVQEGNLGLIRAVEKFDHAKGFKFSTYAVWWIRQAIDRGLAEQARTVRLPSNVVEELSRLNRAEKRLRHELDHDPTAEEVAAATGTPAARVVELRQLSRTTISLETPVGDDGRASVGDLIEDPAAATAYEAVERDETVAELRALVRALPARQVLVLTRRFGLAGGRPHTLQEVADELGLTKERIRQLEKQSLRQLRDLDQAPVERPA